MFATAYAQKERVELAGHLYDFDEVVAAMDAILYYEAIEWAGTGATSQAIVDVYLRLHARRNDKPFTMPQKRRVTYSSR